MQITSDARSAAGNLSAVSGPFTHLQSLLSPCWHLTKGLIYLRIFRLAVGMSAFPRLGCSVAKGNCWLLKTLICIQRQGNAPKAGRWVWQNTFCLFVVFVSFFPHNKHSLVNAGIVQLWFCLLGWLDEVLPPLLFLWNSPSGNVPDILNFQLTECGISF